MVIYCCWLTQNDRHADLVWGILKPKIITYIGAIDAGA